MTNQTHTILQPCGDRDMRTMHETSARFPWQFRRFTNTHISRFINGVLSTYAANADVCDIADFIPTIKLSFYRDDIQDTQCSSPSSSS